MTEAQSNHISTVRQLMIDQLQALRTATPGPALDAEISRSRAVSELSQTVVNSAKVEIDYLKITDQSGSSFLEPTGNGVTTIPGPGNGITSITQHKLRG